MKNFYKKWTVFLAPFIFGVISVENTPLHEFSNNRNESIELNFLMDMAKIKEKSISLINFKDQTIKLPHSFKTYIDLNTVLSVSDNINTINNTESVNLLKTLIDLIREKFNLINNSFLCSIFSHKDQLKNESINLIAGSIEFLIKQHTNCLNLLNHYYNLLKQDELKQDELQKKMANYFGNINRTISIDYLTFLTYHLYLFLCGFENYIANLKIK